MQFAALIAPYAETVISGFITMNANDHKTSRASKKRYEKPRILSREPLEAMAVVCQGPIAKASPGAGTCTRIISS